MTNPYLKTVLVHLVTISWAISFIAGCAPSTYQPSPQQTLISRIDQYYTALRAKAYSKSILFHAHRNRHETTGASPLASKLSLDMATYDVQSMQIENRSARVVMHVTLSGHDNQYDLMVLDHWQLIGDKWFIVDATQAPVNEAIKALNNGAWQGGINW